jgi:hypothetical protein
MNKLTVVFVLGLILASSIFPLVLPGPYVTTRKQWVHFPYLWIYVEAPEESRINESYSVTITVDPFGEVYINSINVEFYNPSYKETILFNTEISSKFIKTYNLKPEYGFSSWCYVDVDYVVDKGTSFERRYYGSFSVYLTKIREKTYDDLEDAYDDLEWDYRLLNSSYNYLKTSYESLSSDYSKLVRDYESLISDYNNLKKNYNDLYEQFKEQNKGVMLYVLTTLIFASTTAYFAWRCRKLEKMQGKSSKEKKEGLIKRIEALFFKVDN